MIEKVKLNETMNAWPASENLNKIVGLNDGGAGSTMSPNVLLTARPIIGSCFTAEGGMYYAAIKTIGRKMGDGKNSVLLISTYDDNSLQSLRGIMGRMYALRGNANSMLVATWWDITCLRAHNGFELSSSNASLKAGKCIYGGKNYLAIQLGSASFFDVFFTGFYSGNCVFIHVLESEVTWI